MSSENDPVAHARALAWELVAERSKQLEAANAKLFAVSEELSRNGCECEHVDEDPPCLACRIANIVEAP